MHDKRFRLLLIWNTVLTVLLLVSFGANAVLVRAAGDPPVRVFSASAQDNDVNGGLSGKLVIDALKKESLLPVELKLSPDHEHYCVAVASLEVEQPKIGGRYDIAIGWENGTYAYTSIRDLRFADVTPETRNEVREVTTVFVHNLKPGNHTLSLLGNKRTAEMPPLAIKKAAMFALCMQPNMVTP